jgi:beta-aspartyl-peptidase (threonine type)
MKVMILYFVPILVLMTGCTENSQSNLADTARPDYVLVIHGGAGTITRTSMTPTMEAAYRKVLNEALNVGTGVLEDGGSALDAVEKTVRFMEDSPLFNAGKGAVFNHAGVNELDASIMEGANHEAGAVGGVSNVRNPISVARAVLERSPHVMLVGKGAEQFAEDHGFEPVHQDYFFTQRRWDALEKLRAKENAVEPVSEEDKHGTVGAVALDRSGNLAAATSTGGMTNKKYNRIGDSPVIGAGTYADNATCAVSSTGHGEFFIRFAVAHAVSAMMAYGDKSIREASDHIIHSVLEEAGGTGGVVGVDHNGEVAMTFNTEGMYRAYAKPGEREVAIYNE